MSRLERALQEFAAALLETHPKHVESLASAFEHFARMLRAHSLDQAVVDKCVKQLGGYVARKARSLDPKTRALRVRTLRSLRNQFVQGAHVDAKDLRRGYDILWRALLAGADEADSIALRNLLEYSLATQPGVVPESQHDPAKIVSAFRGIFRALPDEKKERLFRELLIRLFSHPSLARTLDAAEVDNA